MKHIKYCGHSLSIFVSKEQNNMYISGIVHHPSNVLLSYTYHAKYIVALKKMFRRLRQFKNNNNFEFIASYER